MVEDPHRLRIFLCHSSGDKQAVRDLYKRLCADGFDPWLDEENLLPGQDWHQKIPEAVGMADIVLVCLSRDSINKKGYVQKEIKYALDVADEQPENTIYLIPLKLEECDIPQRLRRWHWVSLFEPKGYERLLNALKHRAESISANPSINGLQSSITSGTLLGSISQEVLLKKEGQLRETKEEHQGQDEKQKRQEGLTGRSGMAEEANRPRELNGSQSGETARIETAAQERAENIRWIDARQKRIKKLTWAGIVLIVLGTTIVIISFTRSRTNSSPNQPSSTHSMNAESYFNRGEECREQKVYDCAIDSYSMAIKLNAQYAEAFYNRGVAYDNKGDYERAINDYSKAIELNSQFATAYNNRGVIYAARGDYRRAIEDYDKAIRLNPQYAVAHYNRGGSYDDMGNYDQAIKDYNKVIELNPQYSEAYFNLGLVYQYKGHYKQAIEAYNKAVEINPQDAEVYNARGLAYERLGQPERAMADRQKYNELSTKR
jgi:tetratricopeptide (TPR) repeat protein